MKKLVAFIFAALIAACAAIADVLPDGGPYTETVDGVEYTFTISNGEATIGTKIVTEALPAIPTGTSGALIVPSELGGCPVTTIGKYAFFYCSSLTSVVIPDSVATIGDYAFNYCRSLTSVRIPKSVTTIGDYCVFSFCPFLTTLELDADNPSYRVEDGILYSKDMTTLVWCSPSKASVTIPSSVTTIAPQAFCACASLSSLTIPSSVRRIGVEAFYSCISLRSLILPSSVTEAGAALFAGCIALTSLEIANDNPLYRFEDGLLYSKDGATLVWCMNGKTSVTIPEYVTTIGTEAFLGCDSLKSVTIPSSVRTIEGFAFRWCSSLESVTISEGVTTIGVLAFEGCNSLTSLTVPSSMELIGESAFFGCESLKSVKILEGTKKIDVQAFYSCFSLTSVEIPSSVESIGQAAFSWCTSLQIVHVANGDANRVKNMLRGFKGVDVETLTFVEEQDRGKVSITGVSAGQNAIDKKVYIDVTFRGLKEDFAKVDCFFTAKNSESEEALPVSTIAKVGEDAGSGTTWTRRYVWDVNADGVTESATVDLRVLVINGGVQLWKGGPFWAECNIGANEPVESGYYFKWGDTIGYKKVSGVWKVADDTRGYDRFEDVTWVSSDGDVMESSPFTHEACQTEKAPDTLLTQGYIDESGNLAATHDAAKVHLGTSWRMPTWQEVDALVASCESQSVTSNGVNGCLINGRGTYASRSIFVPYSGAANNNILANPNSIGYCRSATPTTGLVHDLYTWTLMLGSGPTSWPNGHRFYGFPVRAVRDISAEVEEGECVTTQLSIQMDAGEAVLPETPDYTYNGHTFTHTGWFSNPGENCGNDRVAIGPGDIGTVGVLINGDGTHHPWTDAKLPEAFTLATYMDLSMNNNASTTSKAVIWSTGDGGNNRIMLLSDGENVILSASGGESVSLPHPTPGYHLFTVSFSTSGIALAIDDGSDGKFVSKAASYNSVAAHFQIGSVHGGLPGGYANPRALPIATMVGYNGVLSKAQIALLSERYPATTAATGVITYSVQGGKIFVGSMTHTNGRLEVDRGTLIVSADKSYSVPALRFGNSQSNGENGAFGLELDGTLTISGGQTTDGGGEGGVRSDVTNNRGGVLGGEWEGQGVYNIRGTLDASNSFLQLVYDAHAQTWNVEEGGVLKVKAFEARTYYGKERSTHVLNIKSGGKVVSTQGFTRGKLIANIEEGGVLEIANVADVNMENADLSGITGCGQLKFSNASGSGYVLLPKQPTQFFADTLEVVNDLKSDMRISMPREFTIGSLSGSGDIGSDWNLNNEANGLVRTLTIKQSKDTTWTGNVAADYMNRITAIKITSDNESVLTWTGVNHQTAQIVLLEGGKLRLEGDAIGTTITSGVDGLVVKCVDGVYSLYEPVYIPTITPTIQGVLPAEVTGDALTGFVVKPAADVIDVVVVIPESIPADKVTLEVSPVVQSVKANGATIKVVKDSSDITAFLDIPAAVDGVVNLSAAEVKEAIVKETMDTEKGAIIELSAENPTLTTTATKPGLTYTLFEGTTLDSMGAGASKLGDGTAWTPEIKVKGGASAFYSIKVAK